MKIKKALICICAAVFAFSLYGCSDDGESGQESKSSSLTAKAEIEAPTINKKPAAIPKVKTNDDYVDLVTGYPGVYIANGVNTGINLHAPAGICIYNGEVYEERTSLMPEKIPTAAEPFLISDENGNNMNINVMAGQDYDEFRKLKQSDVEDTFVKGMEAIVDKTEIMSFETGTYDGHSGIKMIVNTTLKGVSMEQTIVMVNAVNSSNNKGYVYTITYTDVTGEMKDKIDESISTIDFLNVSTIAEKYSTPEECAKAQEDGIFESSSSAVVPKSGIPKFETTKPANVPKVTIKRIDRRQTLIDAGIDEDTVDEILEKTEKKPENTKTTLSQEEIRKKYLGE